MSENKFAELSEENDGENKGSEMEPTQIRELLLKSRHPLRAEWCFYYFKPDPTINKNDPDKQQWSKQMKLIAEIGTVEDYWSLVAF